MFGNFFLIQEINVLKIHGGQVTGFLSPPFLLQMAVDNPVFAQVSNVLSDF
jgi:hypothetical protein